MRVDERHRYQAVTLDRTIRPIILAIWACASLAFGAMNLFGATPDKVSITNLRALEEKIPLVNDENLSELEEAFVYRIQLFPRDSYAHFLLSKLYLRQYASHPADLYLLQKSAQLAQQSVELNPMSDMGFVALAEIYELMGHGKNKIGVTAGGSFWNLENLLAYRVFQYKFFVRFIESELWCLFVN